jgi:hypothetical protein
MIGDASYYLRRAARAETVGVGAYSVVNYAQYIPPMPGLYWAAATPNPSAVNATTWSGEMPVPGLGGANNIWYQAGTAGPLTGWIRIGAGTTLLGYYQSLPLAPVPLAPVAPAPVAPTPGAPIAHGPLQSAHADGPQGPSFAAPPVRVAPPPVRVAQQGA